MSSGTSKSALFERQLKKIYDCLNIGSNKKAVQEVDRLPKNIKDSTVFKALKALALIRLGKRLQAFEILNEIDPQNDLDEVTLQTMTSCYKESVDISKIVVLYEAAAARKPNDPEILAHLFMAYVRVFNFKRQKEIAMQMYKSFPKKKRLYSFWAIVSLVMQSQEIQTESQIPGVDKKVCLSLAEKMCEKMIDDERSHEEIELYLMILRKQQKHEEEYRFLTGPSCLRITDHLSWYNRRRAYLCLDLKMYSRAFKHYFPSLIQEYPDQIEYYQCLFKSALLLDTEAISQQQSNAINDQQSTVSAQTTSTPVKSSSALAECYDIVEKQCQSTLEMTESIKEQSKTKSQIASKSLSRTSSLNPNRRRMLRGPLIARIELYHTILSNELLLPKNIYTQCLNQFSAKHPKLSSLLLDFFQTFSKKIICYYDLEYMIDRYKLPSDETSELLRIIGVWVDELSKNQSAEVSTYDMFHINLNYHMLEHSLRKYMISDSREHRLQIAKKYIDIYNENMKLSKQSKTEFLPVDHYCLLAINSIMTNSVNPSELPGPQSFLDDRILISLIVMTETASLNSPSNHQIRLLLLKLYSLIGASKQSANVLLTLDIKHFQIDTLGHLLNPVLYNTGNYSLSKESLETCLEFYAHGVRESFEGLTTSYRDGKYSKIEEISNVLKRLNDSLNGAQCVLLKGVVSSLNASTIDDLVAASQSFDPFKGLHRLFRCPNQKDRMEDNRDFKVLKSLHFEVNDLLQVRQEQTLKDEDLWLRLRYFLLRCVHLQTDLSAAIKSKNREKQNECDEIGHCLYEIDALLPKIMKCCQDDYGSTFSYLEPESTPFRWRHIKFETLVNLVRSLLSYSDPKSGLTEETHDKYLHHLEEIADSIESQVSSITSFMGMKRTLTLLTISLEFISLCVASLVLITNIEANCCAGSQASSMQLLSNQQSSQLTNSKSKSFIQQMISKTEAQLTRMATAVKAVDVRSFIVQRTGQIEPAFSCDSKHCSKAESNGIVPLLSADHSEISLAKVRELIFDSYNESLREIESTIRRKIKLLRAKV